jgi:hypothetical protein
MPCVIRRAMRRRRRNTVCARGLPVRLPLELGAMTRGAVLSIEEPTVLNISVI